MKLKHLYRRSLSLKHILFVLILFFTTCFLIFYFPPTYQLLIYKYHISILYLFFISLFFFLYFTGAFILKSKKHGFFIAFFAISYLIFRLNNLTDPLFLFLLIALFLTVEFLFTRNYDKKSKNLKRD